MEKKRSSLSDMLKDEQPRKKARLDNEEVTKVAEDSTKDINHIIDNPGFHHILENTFLRLDLNDLLKFQQVCQKNLEQSHVLDQEIGTKRIFQEKSS